uniref:Transcriptional regulator n=1 Tax=uncultured Thiotrichaceae bacterium TaxID=298394 RepID=A0A6S6U4L5_9GAMM|nr:MAG: Transcriptional regulator [uncultured Thiotrichaceae bacterium]
MPLYDYQCSACGHEMEALQKMSDAPLTDCPECKDSTLTKQVTAAAFRLSGSGWYETDFKKDNKKNLADNGNNTQTSKKETPKTPTVSKPGPAASPD